MGFGALIRCLGARKLILGWSALVGLAVGLATGALLPKTYESSAKVLVDSIQKDSVTGLYEPRLRVSEFLGQQAAIADSRTVALEAYDRLAEEGLIAVSDFEERWRRETGGEIVAGNDPRLWAADELVENLTVTADAVDVRKVDGWGRVRSARLPSYFARVEFDRAATGPNALRLSS